MKQIWTRNKMIVNRRDNHYKKIKYIECKICHKQIKINIKKKCKGCINKILTEIVEDDYNYNSGNEIQVQREQVDESVNYVTDINKRNKELKNQGYIESIK